MRFREEFRFLTSQFYTRRKYAECKIKEDRLITVDCDGCTCEAQGLRWLLARGYTATVTEVSVRVTGRYSVSRSMGSRPASRIRRTNSSRRMPCGVVAPASW